MSPHQEQYAPTNRLVLMQVPQGLQVAALVLVLVAHTPRVCGVIPAAIFRRMHIQARDRDASISGHHSERLEDAAKLSSYRNCVMKRSVAAIEVAKQSVALQHRNENSQSDILYCTE